MNWIRQNARMIRNDRVLFALTLTSVALIASGVAGFTRLLG
jgi:hypothetical protein